MINIIEILEKHGVYTIIEKDKKTRERDLIRLATELENYNPLSELQCEVSKWIAMIFPDDNLDDAIHGIFAEGGELAQHYRDRKHGISGTYEHHTKEIKDAIGDIMINILEFCCLENINLVNQTLETFSIVKTRKYEW